MFTMFIITFREGLEAALVVGIVLGVLTRLGWSHLKRYVWSGTFTALGLSVAAGIMLALLGMELEGRAEEIFEGVTMLVAAGLLTWMILWMRIHGKAFARALETKTEEAARVGSRALFALSFFAVLREGLETALFLIAASFKGSGIPLLIGGVLGLALAVLIGVLIFRASIKIPLRLLFNVTGVLLLLVAAGLVASGVHELQEARLLPVLVEQVWDTSAILSEKGVIGGFLKALFGYNADPSFLEVVVYFAYLVIVGGWGWRLGTPPRRSPA